MTAFMEAQFWPNIINEFLELLRSRGFSKSIRYPAGLFQVPQKCFQEIMQTEFFHKDIFFIEKSSIFTIRYPVQA